MKPLPSAPPTLEDSDIWLSIVVAYGLDWATAGVIFRDADRRDADLMHALTHLEHTCQVCARFGVQIEWLSSIPAVRRSAGNPT